MSQDRPDKTDYVLVYDGEHGVRLAPAGAGHKLTLEEKLGWAPRESWEISELDFEVEAPPTTRRSRHVFAGVAGLCALGLALGLTVRSPRMDLPPTASAPKLAPVAAVPPAAMPVVATPPPAMARHERGTRAASPHKVVAVHTKAATPRLAAARSGDRPTAACAGSSSHADAMVCGDATLAAADRRLGRAMAAAVQAGAPLEQLSAQQEEWRNAREMAAHMSRKAVAGVYERRIGELEAMTAKEPPY